MQRSFVALVVLAQFLIGPALAQDRPLLEPFRIGYPLSGSAGAGLKSDNTLHHELRRAGLMLSWQSFSNGLAAIQALHADEIDVALDIPQLDVLLARAQGLNMSFVAATPDDGNRIPGRASADDIADRRYTLSSDHLNRQGKDALLRLTRALRRAGIPAGGSNSGLNNHAAIPLSFTPHAASVAKSSETWICTDGEPDLSDRLIVLALDGELLLEQSLNITRFKVLENNRYAVIAANHSSDFDPVLNKFVILIAMVTLDKLSSNFIYTTALGDSAVRQRTGHCRGFGEGTENALNQGR